jgi:peptide/nickel transport system ATP-binding protein
MTLLRVENLRVDFRADGTAARAVDGLDLALDEGEAVGLVGESGCGKTVTALSLMGLVPEPAGRIVAGSSIRLRERELVGRPSGEVRRIRGREIAMVFQEPMTSLNPVYSVGDQVREAVILHRGAGRREARRVAVELLGEVGLPDPEVRFRAYPHQLSGGMRQRVMIAMALAGEPSLLLADEPTTALDVTIQAQILELLDGLRRRRGMALLLITHDLGVVAEVCDRVLVMYAGHVVEEGPVGEVFASPRHPYTRGLLDSLPRLGAEGSRLRPIAGAVPAPGDRPEGCRFRDRCPRAWERCADPPPLFRTAAEGAVPRDHGPDAPTRASRCWLEEDAG